MNQRVRFIPYPSSLILVFRISLGAEIMLINVSTNINKTYINTMKTLDQTISASSLFFGIVHCLGIALLGFYLFDEESRKGKKIPGLRMITRN